MSLLTTVERARGFLRAPADDDEQLALLIPAASATIETYCNRLFGHAAHVEHFEDCAFMKLRNYPIVSIISIDGSADLNEYSIDARYGIVRHEKGCRNPVDVEYEAGYILPGDELIENVEPLPADIEYACILLIKQMQREPGVASERVGDLAVTYAQDDGKMPPAVRALVGPYRSINT